MNITILLSEQKGTRKQIEVKAYSKETALVFLKANTIQDAIDLIPKGNLEAFTAMKNWMPQEQPEEEPQQKGEQRKFYPLSEEAAQRILETYGRDKFTRTADDAEMFVLRNGRGLSTNMVLQLVAEGYHDVYKAIEDAYNIGFKRGHAAGKKAAKK